MVFDLVAYSAWELTLGSWICLDIPCLGSEEANRDVCCSSSSKRGGYKLCSFLFLC